MTPEQIDPHWMPNAVTLARGLDRRGRHWLAHLAAPLYRFRRLKSYVLRLCLKLEGETMFSATLRDLLRRHHGVTVGRYTYGDALKPGLLPPGTVVGRYCSVGTGLVVRRRNHPLERPFLHPFFYNSNIGLLKQDTIGTDRDNPLTIGHDVWIADRVTILAGCRSIGNGAVLGAGAIVTQDVPPYAIVAGVPARAIRMRFDPARIARLEASRWWEQDIDALIRNPPVEDVFAPL